MNEKPIVHGFDHRVGGSDPIPGLRLGAWAALYIDTGTVTIPSTAETAIAFPAQAGFIDFPDVFSTDGTGITCLLPGVFVVESGIRWSDTTVGGHVHIEPPLVGGLYGGEVNHIDENTNLSFGGTPALNDGKDYVLFPVAKTDTAPVFKAFAFTSSGSPQTLSHAFLRVAFIPCYWT